MTEELRAAVAAEMCEIAEQTGQQLSDGLSQCYADAILSYWRAAPTVEEITEIFRRWARERTVREKA